VQYTSIALPPNTCVPPSPPVFQKRALRLPQSANLSPASKLPGNRLSRTTRPNLQLSDTMDLPRQPDATADDEARSFSTHQERASDASEIELMPLVPSTASTIQHDGVPDRTADLRNDTDTATSPGEIDGPAHKDRSSLHSPEPGPRTKDSSFLKKLAFDSWIGEAIAMALSIGCLVAIAVIVYNYDGAPLPQWRGGVTLNTVIAVLSTTARSGMVFVASATMGQLK
jgi:hypothetical protein